MSYIHKLHFSPSSSSSSSCSCSPSPLPHFISTKRYLYKTTQLSFSTPNRRRSRRNTITKKRNSINKNDDAIFTIPDPSDDQKLKLVLDINRLSILASSKFRYFLDTGKDAFSDLGTLVSLDENRRLVVSCRKTTMQFVGVLVILGFIASVTVKALFQLGSRFAYEPKVVVRRDRSLGGREVVVAVDESNYNQRLRAKENPVSSGRVSDRSQAGYPGPAQKKLPKWWPVSVATKSWVADTEEYQREANRLIRVMVDYRTSGKDMVEDHIIQLRRICRTAGVRVSIDPANTRDSFYRASVEFVLNVCSRAPSQNTSVEIDGEDAREFVAGLAENIELENIRAARMLSAAVAAHTRSWFLQAWALEMQGKHSEGLLELSKICLVHRIFPPEESSPEMEMVARGLEKLLRTEERMFLMEGFSTVCGDSRRSAAEALGLMSSIDDQY